jgi:2-oxoglutarate ferredoxin oxidoreductase subunit beta
MARSIARQARAFALGAGARFVARGFDVSKNLPEVLKAAYNHKGAAFVEIFQNCIVYNKDVFDDFAAPKGAEDRQLWLKHGEPMLFGSDKTGGVKGITLDRENLCLKVVDVVDGDWQAAGVIVHDVHQPLGRAHAGRDAVRPLPDGAGRAL